MKENSVGAFSRPHGDIARWHIVLAFTSAIYLYLNLFSSLRFPFLLSGDQIYFWMGAQRIVGGQAIYRDFFQCTPPGTDLVYAACFKVFGETIWVTNAVALVLGVLSACLCFSLARQLMKNAPAMLATALFLVLIYGKFLNATHHWFAVLLIFLAVRVSMERLSIGRMAWSGALLGLASFFNHVHAAAALFAFVIYLLLSGVRKHEERVHMAKSAAALILTFGAVALCLYAHYLGTVGFERLWFCLVQAVSRYAAETPWSFGLPGRLGWRLSPDCCRIWLFTSFCHWSTRLPSGNAGACAATCSFPGTRPRSSV
ncbi:4-amino-4-deoxy-L-arabinose transferase-like glycosyltransferase [Silvibacterium bohemicum]|uniref:4-amino-4-deoxy-L-arabinose transferase-like glycosyltransferase n=1 Tax=Silvibacterium bohemicum TaxID=1577686 RepID=A0A841K8S4_9BACT|nr:4-amino-4-deoxy-L-arabinose transferase-like glycosyltransferase [Silvibacterium bohemicum]